MIRHADVTLPNHDARVEALVQQVRELAVTAAHHDDARFRSPRLDTSTLCHVLEIDPEGRRCIAEPGVRFRDLVRATLPLGLVPTVVPELEGITLGGDVRDADFNEGVADGVVVARPARGAARDGAPAAARCRAQRGAVLRAAVRAGGGRGRHRRIRGGLCAVLEGAGAVPRFQRRADAPDRARGQPAPFGAAPWRGGDRGADVDRACRHRRGAEAGA